VASEEAVITRAIEIIDDSGNRTWGAFAWSDDEPWQIVFRHPSCGEQSFEAPDLFDALQSIRHYLTKHGWQLLCYGARSDVYPSGMSRESTGGRIASMLTIGQRPQRSDLVDIFNPTTDDHSGTVADQETYYCAWVKSVGADV